MTTLRYNLVDVFTDVRFAGNQLAVFVRAAGTSPELMQAIAREMNLSETTFVLPAERDGHARVRIFTSRKELPFAGHPVLGTAWVLGSHLVIPELRLETGAGTICVEMRRDGDRLSEGWMTQPVPTWQAEPQAAAIERALGISGSRDGLLATTRFCNGPEHVLVEVRSCAALSCLAPDFSALAHATEAGVLAFSHSREACSARYFAPASGILEDPATGSAIGPLAVHLHLAGRLASTTELRVRQGVEMLRPSLLRASVIASTAGIERVRVGGSAVVVGRGELQIS